MKVLRVGFVFLALIAAGVAAGATLLPPEALAQVKKAAQKVLPPKTHKVAIQVNQNERGVMELALNNARNIDEYFKGKGEAVQIEIVTYGPGLHMLRSESPVKDRVATMSLEHPNLTFSACQNTQTNMSKMEGRPVTLLSEARLTPSGVVRLMELQGNGYAYIRP